MTITKFEALFGLLVAALTILGIIAAGVRWIYRQGASSAKLVSAIDSNTVATTELSAAYSKSTERTEAALLDHEKRLTRLESRP